MAPPPATDWHERIGADEASRHAAQAKQLVEIQRVRSEKYGAGRGLHRKALVGLAARLEVKDGLPEHARHGLFAKPAGFDAWVRLSNGSPDRQSDRKPDIRGFALRVDGVSGDGALGGAASHQDFLLINTPTFGMVNSAPFMGLVQAAAKGPLALIGWGYRTYGLRRMFGKLRALKAGLERPFAGFAAEPFYSSAPIACGPYAARVRLTPNLPTPHPDARGEWGAAMIEAVTAGPIAYTLALQFFVDETRTPIEDASVDWAEDVAPYLPVADLTIAAQEPASEAGRELAAKIERAVFDPWQALAEHRPLGEVMRARKVAYFASQQARAAES